MIVAASLMIIRTRVKRRKSLNATMCGVIRTGIVNVEGMSDYLERPRSNNPE